MECVSCLSSVTQGSVLGLLLLSCISRLLPTLLQLSNLYQHQYAEPALYDHSIDCLQVVPDNLLLLNQMKTEVIVCSTRVQNNLHVRWSWGNWVSLLTQRWLDRHVMEVIQLYLSHTGTACNTSDYRTLVYPAYLLESYSPALSLLIVLWLSLTLSVKAYLAHLQSQTTYRIQT